jgi:hypothetical protein
MTNFVSYRSHRYLICSGFSVGSAPGREEQSTMGRVRSVSPKSIRENLASMNLEDSTASVVAPKGEEPSTNAWPSQKSDSKKPSRYSEDCRGKLERLKKRLHRR